jgi:hypothetical protein
MWQTFRIVNMETWVGTQGIIMHALTINFRYEGCSLPKLTALEAIVRLGIYGHIMTLPYCT